MKKIFALLLAMTLVLVSGVSLAETAAQPTIGFDIKMDKLPEGYTCQTTEKGGSLLAVFTKEGDESAPVIFVSVAYSDEFEGFTLSGDLSAEQYDNMVKTLTQDYNKPLVELRETAYGTKVIFVSECDAQSDYMDAVTVWNGYFITLSILKATDVTDEDVSLATAIISDMWVIAE